MNYLNVPYEINRAIEECAESMAGMLAYAIEHKELSSIDECREFIHDLPIEDTLAIRLTLDHRLETVEWFGDDYGFMLENSDMSNLRTNIEGMACMCIHFQACAMVDDVIGEIEDFMDDEKIEFSDAVHGNSYGWARHYGERYIGGNCTVYEYRNVEETYVDVYVFHALDIEIFFQKSIDPDEVTDEEKYFDAA